jgi:hypothetical protein
MMLAVALEQGGEGEVVAAVHAFLARMGQTGDWNPNCPQRTNCDETYCRCGPVSVLPSDTSASRALAIGCKMGGFGVNGLELRSVTRPFQPPRRVGCSLLTPSRSEPRAKLGTGSNRSLVGSYHCFRSDRWCNLRGKLNSETLKEAKETTGLRDHRPQDERGKAATWNGGCHCLREFLAGWSLTGQPRDHSP